jgi:hypothetical protein
MHDWCNKFSEDHEEVAEQPQALVQLTAITDENFLNIKGFILEKKAN